jgi:hypothetical protein
MARTSGVVPSQGFELEGPRIARIYANLSWYITPLKGKAPYQKDWPSTATKGESNIARWVAESRNIALVTGSGSGVVVIDVDPRNGGSEALSNLQASIGPLPSTLTCNTGGGGQHYYFRYWKGAKSGKPFSGIDFQCDRRCVVLPPSMHPDTGALYDWVSLPTIEGIAELPESWKQALCNPEPHTQPAEQISQGPIQVGERNDTLFKLAVNLAKGGASERRIAREVAEENAVRCSPPLSVDEVDKIVRSSLSYRESNQSVLTRFQQAVASRVMPTARKAALWSLALYADQHGRNCYPTIEQIAEGSGLARETAGKHLAIAAAEGWFKRITHSRAAGPGFNYSYILQVPGPEPQKDES